MQLAIASDSHRERKEPFRLGGPFWSKRIRHQGLAVRLEKSIADRSLGPADQVSEDSNDVIVFAHACYGEVAKTQHRESRRDSSTGSAMLLRSTHWRGAWSTALPIATTRS
jgi:hypothetical protein